jgi:heme O synthase-like polyprenyltransferase
MAPGLLSTPRPVPGRLLPALAGTTVVVLALPVFLLAGFPIAGWGIAAVLWIGSQALTALLTRLRPRTGNLAPAPVLALGMTFRAIAMMLVLVAVTVSDARLGLSAAIVYALAYTLELGVGLVTYFSGGTDAPA